MTYEERKNQVKHYLGKTVTVRIDRPVGSVHPKHPEVIYPINYGYIPGVIGGDGEELDVYAVSYTHLLGLPPRAFARRGCRACGTRR